MSARRALFILAAFLAPVIETSAFADGFAGLGGEAKGFAEVVEGTPIVFPRDFGPHPAFRTEWWYLTANLEDAAGASYGLQWTLFRQASAPGDERQGWAIQNIWMAHAAVTNAKEHLFAETFARGGVGLAGVTAEPFRAWIDNWRFSSRDDAPGAGLARMMVEAAGPDFRYKLNLAVDRPPVLHGKNGFSVKSDDGRASYYFSQPFFKIDGVLVIRGQEIKVSGLAWMDREWSSQPLTATQKGWDWFSLHFTNGEKVMVFQLRDETARAFRAGTWIHADGTSEALDRDDIALTPLSRIHLNGRTLPGQWKLTVKSRGVEVETTPLNADSWMATRFSYWEGPISFRGSHEGKGYLEMTGY
ncbi:lipocalin-like domain-containing protein [Rhodoblastus sp. 17X3]|uniref:lipocalin-like domain-containing protein n=1 Tax=Rhodoblastus sp. 17X3 TaxID=3047026 RepID=UPI0024B72318|nr:lipocalin-like domain-containing protein [Rhodoblastus sp. 17X3]MDI9849643.1 lipocalin-like domain-containing protein [Rhodoblastus sp. 17X3]